MIAAAVDAAEKIALLNLLALDGIGSGTALRLVGKLGSAQAVFGASGTQLATVPRLSAAQAQQIRTARADGDTGKQRFEQAEAAAVTVCTYWDPDYPPALKGLEQDAPAVLFIRGHLPAAARRLAVVGTRSATAYGKRVTHDLVLGLRGSGLHIVSGLASGIDGCSHEAALEAGLPTEAVFGCGVDHIYPPIHEGLAHRILAAGGALVSEYPLDTPPDRHHFPQRNRIIAGLSHGTLVVEAGDRSGALITALLALEYNREVMAVPGAVTNPRATGCHRLIRNGATLVERTDDILRALEMRLSAASAPAAPAGPPLDKAETALVALLDVTEAAHVDELAEKAGLPVGELLGQLLLLELKGAVKQLPGKYFVRA